MSQHPPELVERVAREFASAYYAYCGDGEPAWQRAARYALDLAERSADAAVTAYRLNDAPGGEAVLARAVRRAVEGA